MLLDLSSADRPMDMDPLILGRKNFLLRPGHFSVIDGDTIWAMTNTNKDNGDFNQRQKKSFGIRFRSIAAPEKPKGRATDRTLKAAGIDPHWDSAGKKATELLKMYLDDRALLVQPTGRIDRYGRMLADMCVVPYTRSEPDLGRAMSLEQLMLVQGTVNPFRKEIPPPLHPVIYEEPA
jgi:endonuclease YncB( thermonuclease family)